MNSSRHFSLGSLLVLGILSLASIIGAGCTQKQKEPPSGSGLPPAKEKASAPSPAVEKLLSSIQPKVDGSKAAPAVPPAPPAPAAQEKAPAPKAKKDGGCAGELEEIRKIFQGIPEDYREAKNIEELTRTVQALRDRCEKFLAACPGEPDLHEVQYMLGRLLISLSQVEWTNFVGQKTKEGLSDSAIQLRKDWFAKYHGRIVELSRAALGKFEPGKPLRAKCLDLLGDALYQSGQPEKALETYRKLLEEFPKYEKLASIYMSMGRCCQDLQEYAKGIEILRKASKELPDDPSYPFFLENLWQILTHAGDLHGLSQLVEEMRAEAVRRLARPEIGKLEKEAWDRSLAYNGFRKGYIEFALGLFPEATRSFREHLSYMEKLKKERGAIPQDYQVYEGRSRDNLAVLESKIGKPVPVDLEKAIWVGGRKLALDQRPIAILFRNYGEERPYTFLQALDRHARSSRDSYELATISFLKGAVETKDAQAAEVLAETQSLGLECAVGLDPDAGGRRLFRAFQATVGSATLVILDRNGNYAWFQQDPIERDVRFSTAILERIIAK